MCVTNTVYGVPGYENEFANILVLIEVCKRCIFIPQKLYTLPEIGIGFCFSGRYFVLGPELVVAVCGIDL